MRNYDGSSAIYTVVETEIQIAFTWSKKLAIQIYPWYAVRQEFVFNKEPVWFSSKKVAKQADVVIWNKNFFNHEHSNEVASDNM